MTKDEVRDQVRDRIVSLGRDGLTVADIAARLGISIPTVYRLKRGERIDGTTVAVVCLLSDRALQAA